MTTIRIISLSQDGDNAIRRFEKEQEHKYKHFLPGLMVAGWRFECVKGVQWLVYKITVPKEISNGKIKRLVDKKITKTMYKNGATYDEDYIIDVME